MRDEQGSVLGGLEREVMQTMWAASRPLTVRAVLDRLNRRRQTPLAYTTVMTVMARLADKEILTRRPLGRGYEYEPLVPDEAAIAVRDLMRDFGEAAISHFVEEARADPKLRRRIARLLEDRQ